MKTNDRESSTRQKKHFPRITEAVSRWPIFVVTSLFVLGAIMIFWHTYALQEHLVESAALRNAALYTQALAEFRSIYTSEVVNTVKKQGIEVTHDYEKKEGAIPLPVTLSMKLGKAIGNHQSGAETRLYSAYPFPWRRKNNTFPDAFAREAWQALSRAPQEPYYRFENYRGRPSIRYATADLMRSSCIQCHNTHPQAPKNDWQVGDVRGVLEIIHPLDELVLESQSGLRGTFTLLAFLTVSAVVALVLVTKSLRDRTMEATQNAKQTEVANQSLNEEIVRRQRLEEDLLEAREGLEGRIEERTTELTLTNEKLQLQLEWREQAQGEIGEALQNLEWKNWELGVRTEELEQSNKELEDFAYIASHDLQEPLRKVQAFGTRLQKCCKDGLSKQGQDYLERMQNAASRMQGLIDDLLRYSRVTTLAKNFVEVNLNEVVAEVLSDLEVAVSQSDGRVDVSPLPTVHADPVQMRQLFQNLIGNALKYRGDKAPLVRITACCAEVPEGDLVATLGQTIHEIVVEDNGIGFEEKYAERIFGMFQRLHGRGEYKGTGVGLAICRKIVLRHGGQITAYGKPGEGSRFVVSLPTGNEESASDG